MQNASSPLIQSPNQPLTFGTWPFFFFFSLLKYVFVFVKTLHWSTFTLDDNESIGDAATIFKTRKREKSFFCAAASRAKRRRFIKEFSFQGNGKVNSKLPPPWWSLMLHLMESKYVLLHLTDGSESGAESVGCSSEWFSNTDRGFIKVKLPEHNQSRQSTPQRKCVLSPLWLTRRMSHGPTGEAVIMKTHFWAKHLITGDF